MTLPCQPVVQLRLGTGASLGDVLILGDQLEGILGTNVLGTATAQIVEITSLCDQISIRRGRDRVFEQYTAGQATIRFRDYTGDWNPDNASGPYYGQILPMRQVRITTTYSSTEYALFTGYITSWDWDWPKGAQWAWVTIQADDGFRLLSLSTVDNVPAASSGDLPGERINQLLDLVSWPSTMRNIDTGATELQTDPGGIRTTLQACQTVEATELGALFMDRDGTVRFQSRGTISSLATQTAVDFADDGTGIDYQGIDVALDDTELSNYVTVQRHGGTAETAQDATSIADYFVRALTRTELLMRTNADALAQANSILAYRKTPRMRINSITLDLSENSNRVQPALDLDFGDPIYVTRTQSPGNSVTLRVTVQGVDHDIRPDRWITRLSTREPLSTAFILGSSQFGILGTNTL